MISNNQLLSVDLIGAFLARQSFGILQFYISSISRPGRNLHTGWTTHTNRPRFILLTDIHTHTHTRVRMYTFEFFYSHGVFNPTEQHIRAGKTLRDFDTLKRFCNISRWIWDECELRIQYNDCDDVPMYSRGERVLLMHPTDE